MNTTVGNETFTTFEDIKAKSKPTQAEEDEIELEIRRIGTPIKARESWDDIEEVEPSFDEIKAFEGYRAAKLFPSVRERTAIGIGVKKIGANNECQS
jgi:hypothetical protein